MAGANFIATILNPNKTSAFNYTALKYFSQLIATGENKINLIFETDSHRESPRPGAPAASEPHAVAGAALVLRFQVPGTLPPPRLCLPPSLVQGDRIRVQSFPVALDAPQRPLLLPVGMKSDFRRWRKWDTGEKEGEQVGAGGGGVRIPLCGGSSPQASFHLCNL